VQWGGVAANNDRLGRSSLLPPPTPGSGGTWLRRGVRGGTPLSAGGEVCSQRGLAANWAGVSSELDGVSSELDRG
jgi:hypothetical protein